MCLPSGCLTLLCVVLSFALPVGSAPSLFPTEHQFVSAFFCTLVPVASWPGEIGPGWRSVRNGAISWKRDQCRESVVSAAWNGPSLYLTVVGVFDVERQWGEDAGVAVQMRGSGAGRMGKKSHERGRHQTTTVHGRVHAWMRLRRYRITNIWEIACNSRTS